MSQHEQINLDKYKSKPTFTITKISLNNFRNYSDLELFSNKSPVVIIGENGSGKTNILEAISFLAPGKGLRSVKYEDVTHKSNKLGWSVSAIIDDTQNNFKPVIGTGIFESKKPNKSGRILKVDEEFKPISFLSKLLSILWITPQMDGIFLGETSKRRKFFDRLVLNFDTEHIKQLNIYEKALRDRSRILKDKINDEKWLDLIEKSLANSGVAISIARKNCIRVLNKKLFSVVGTFPAAKVIIDCNIQEWLDIMDPNEAEKKFIEEIKKARSIDSLSGRSKIGPHRSDFKVLHLKKNLYAEKCSTGEQKALLVAIILGQSRLLIDKDGRAPILLLDDIVAHLDYAHLDSLFSELFTINPQVWVTATDPQTLQKIFSNFQLIKVADNKVHNV
ncbi:MAG: DNA replication/repair protein RecF [Rhodospirillaceae bacterium]|nr:DNA replication/repair protein RecF [Rhodospirillaceae bacterium]